MADEIVTLRPTTAKGSDVLKHPTFGQSPVQNVKAPGPKNGTVSLQAARRTRRAASVPPTSAEALASGVLPQRPGSYNYPKSMLLTQEFFCRGFNGVWRAPSMCMGMLVDERYDSPLGALLTRLETEGHDVSGARAEWLAFRELARAFDSEVEQLAQLALRLRSKRPVAALTFLEGQPK